jgi:hypothetical protein
MYSYLSVDTIKNLNCHIGTLAAQTTRSQVIVTRRTHAAKFGFEVPENLAKPVKKWKKMEKIGKLAKRRNGVEKRRNGVEK